MVMPLRRSPCRRRPQNGGGADLAGAAGPYLCGPARVGDNGLMTPQQPGQPGQPASEQPEKRGRGPGRPFTKNDPRLSQNIAAAREAEQPQPSLSPEPFEVGSQLYRDIGANNGGG